MIYRLFICLLLILCGFGCTVQKEVPFYSIADKTPFIAPQSLRPGDTIAIVAPSGVIKLSRSAEINRAIALIESWGLHAKIGDNVYVQANHFAGTDQQRAGDFQEALNNPNIKAIWCARGGYGAVRIVDKLSLIGFKRYPKWIIGYSDITVLHNLIQKNGYKSLHAMMCVSVSEDQKGLEHTISTFKDALFGKPLNYIIPTSKFNKPGTASAPLVGGNLTLLNSMLGSSTRLNTSGKILFIEEIGEYKYHIDRMLQSLKRAGYFNNLKGLIVGNFSNIKKNTTPWGQPIEQLILDVVAPYNFPVLFGMPAGHENDNRALILGDTVTINVSNTKPSKIQFGS